MNIRELTSYIKKIVDTIPVVYSFNDVDPYSYWNSQEVKYGSVIFAVKGYLRLGSVNRYNCILYYGDRVLPDESNVNDIYTDAQNVINHIIGNIVLSQSNINIMEGSPSITLFRQRFLDDLAGGYCNFTIEDAEMVGDCGYNDGMVIEPDAPITPDTFLFNIVYTPSNATVMINGEEKSSVVAQKGTLLQWSVSSQSYITQTGVVRLNEDTTLRIDLEPVQYTYTINASPSGSIIRINGEVRNFITAPYGTLIEWSVEKTGYETQSGSFYLTDNRTDDIQLEVSQHTFTINATPVDAVVMINGVERTSLTAPYGTLITWSVSKEHYVSQSGSFTLTSNRTENVNLAIERYTYTINAAPNGVVVMINGTRRTSITADYGTLIEWSVSKEHYQTQSGSFTLSSNRVDNITLVMDQFTFTINATPADATVVINGVERTTVTVDYGTTINWSVSKVGYATQTGSCVLVDDRTENVTLVEEYHTFTINATPNDATVIINGQERSTLTAGYGTLVEWSVTKTGYETQSGSYVLIADRTENVNLSIIQITFTINPDPIDAIVTINGQRRTTITVPYGTTITWQVEREGYNIEADSFTATESQTITVSLSIMQFTFSIIADPGEAIITINGEETDSITADYGTWIEWSVELEGYETQSDSFELIDDVTEEVYLELIKYDFNIEVNVPALITMNDVEFYDSDFATAQFPPETYVDWTVSAPGYGAQTGREYITEDTTLQITLEESFLKFYITSPGYIAWKCNAGRKTIQYSTDDGETWNNWVPKFTDFNPTIDDSCSIYFNEGDVVLLRGDADKYGGYSGGGYHTFSIPRQNSNGDWVGNTVGFTIGGDIGSLIGDQYKGDLKPYAFAHLFSDLRYVEEVLTPPSSAHVAYGENIDIDANDPLVLSFDRLSDGCYMSMFGDSGGGTHITRAPIITARMTAYRCCDGMFYKCKYLTASPILRAKSLSYGCYDGMFNGCERLSLITCLATDKSANDCVNFTNAPIYAIQNVTLAKDVNTDWGDFNSTDNWSIIDFNPSAADIYKKYLVFDVEEEGSITWNKNASTSWDRYVELQYSSDDGENWDTLYPNSEILVNPGDRICWKGTTAKHADGLADKYYSFGGTARYLVGGKINALSGVGYNYGWGYSYPRLFYGNENIDINQDHPLVLGYGLDGYDYYEMFAYCTSLTTAPIMPAMQMASYCYYGMFRYCTSLDEFASYDGAPYYTSPLPALDFSCIYKSPSRVPGCYKRMFEGCTHLTGGPELLAPVVVEECYDYMFKGCSNLQSITCNAEYSKYKDDTQPADPSSGVVVGTTDWVDGVNGSGLFYGKLAAQWTTGSSGIPTNFTTHLD